MNLRLGPFPERSITSCGHGWGDSISTSLGETSYINIFKIIKHPVFVNDRTLPIAVSGVGIWVPTTKACSTSFSYVDELILSPDCTAGNVGRGPFSFSQNLWKTAFATSLSISEVSPRNVLWSTSPEISGLDGQVEDCSFQVLPG